MDNVAPNTTTKKYPRNKLGHLMHTIGVTANATTKFAVPIRVLTPAEQKSIARQGR